VAFASASGSGKSTAALSMLESGWHLVTNDWLFVRPIQDGVEMVGVPKRPRVNPGTLMRLPRLSAILSGDRRALYGRMSPEALYSVKDKHEVDVDALYGAGTFRLRAIVHAVYVLRWSAASSGWEVRPLGSVEREAVLLSFAKGAGIYDRRGDDPVAVRSQIQEVARAVAVYEVYGRIDVARLTAAVLEAASAHEGFTTQRPR
jgi:HprK-related kinase B